MNQILTSYGLLHIKEQTFGYCNISTLSRCVQVSKEWNLYLSEILLIKKVRYLMEVKPMVYTEYDEDGFGVTKSSTFIDRFPDWQSVLTYLLYDATLEELKIIVRHLQNYHSDYNEYCLVTPPLHYAAMVEDWNVWKILLLNTDIDFNLRYPCNFNTALHYLFSQDHPDLATVCLIMDRAQEKGIDLVAKNFAGDTILHEAARNCRDPKVFQVLFESLSRLGFDVNAANCNGTTPLHCACRNGLPDIVKYLVNSRAIDAQATDNYGKTILHYAVDQPYQPNFPVLEFLLKIASEIHLNVHQRNENGLTAEESFSFKNSQRNPDWAKAHEMFQELTSKL